jgi:hypothetical protein
MNIDTTEAKHFTDVAKRSPKDKACSLFSPVLTLPLLMYLFALRISVVVTWTLHRLT